MAQAKLHSPVRPAITGIAHIVVYETDMSAARSFYSGLLGWPAAPALESDKGVRFIVSKTQYVEAMPLPDNATGDYLDHIAFATSNARQMLLYLKAKGVQTPPAVKRHSDGSRFFMVNDPEGYRIEFVESAAIKVPPAAQQPLSTHIIHAGLAVRNGAAEDSFYKDILGFHLYWHSCPHPDGSVDYVSMQVPDGTDWLEYMQNAPQNRTRKRLASADHFAPGVISVEGAEQLLKERGWTPGTRSAPRQGHDGKWQLNLWDPSGTRVELMEFKPTATPCVPFSGSQPGP
jgi:catechol 2,3-dioxygenase-like lactoylglutathione lyase family enzyme